MQVEVDLKCMQTNFGGRDLSGFGVMASFCLLNFPSVHGGQKIESAQKIHASRG